MLVHDWLGGLGSECAWGRSENASGPEGTAGCILPFVSDTLPPETRKAAASDIAIALEGYASFVDWQQKEDVQWQMRRATKERLRSVGVSPRLKLPPRA